MINRSIFALLLLGWIALPSGIRADEALDRAISEMIIQYYDLDTARVEIEMRRNRLETATGKYDRLEIEPMTKSDPRGLMPFMVQLFNNGSLVERRQVRVKIAWYQESLVAAERITMHDIITPEQYSLQRVEVTSLTDRPLTSAGDLDGKRARKNIRRGQILTAGLIETIPDIQTGDAVAIEYINNLLEITARGVALETGNIGDVIRVKNAGSNKIIACTIVDDETVRVSSH